MKPERKIRFVARSERKRRVIGAVLTSDIIALALATLGATYLRFDLGGDAGAIVPGSGGITYWQLSIVVAIIWLVSLWAEDLYDLERMMRGAGEFSRVARALGIGVVAFILISYGLKLPGLSRAWTLIAFALALSLVSAGRLATRTWFGRIRRRGAMQRRTVVVGGNAEAGRIIAHLKDDPAQGFTPVGIVAHMNDDMAVAISVESGVPLMGAVANIRDLVLAREVDTVAIASSAFDHEAVSAMINHLRGLDVTINVSSALSDVLTSRVLVRDIAGVPFMTVRAVAFRRGALRSKRLFDTVLSLACLIIGLPFWLVIMAIIKLDSRGPIFYRQERVGMNGENFMMMKFRSMVVDAEARLAGLKKHNEASGPLFKIKDDPRITSFGRWMRKYSIDEFPQLVNVLKGEMSLVGPRPPLPCETEQYSEQDWRRMEVPPGMTGLWQVSGRSTLTFDEMIRLDLFYIENWSLGFDITLLLRTIPAALFARGAY